MFDMLVEFFFIILFKDVMLFIICDVCRNNVCVLNLLFNK